ncbi:MAG: type IV secretory system conjugative DNA transfer family protein [Butyrivibrio sp.]|nr:type IV secretory system conjugative DNA transfer family protein [Butyrivibrio sp.]
MGEKMLILGEDQFFSMDCHKTKLNNNVLVVGTSGAGKTRSIVTPNLIQATGSYVVSDPKGNLYKKYKAYLEKEGYKVRKLDFTEPEHSSHYNFFSYINNTRDILKVAHMLIYQHEGGYRADPFWYEAGQLLLQAAMSYLIEECPKKEHNLHNLLKLVNMCNTFFTQAMNELCRYADKECEDCTLPVPVRFIMDDFATNCKIEDFHRMIASIRSRGIPGIAII